LIKVWPFLIPLYKQQQQPFISKIGNQMPLANNEQQFLKHILRIHSDKKIQSNTNEVQYQSD
jgi:hypothetical protein